MADYIAEKVLCIALQRFEFRIGFTDDVRLSLHASPQKRAQAHKINHLDALQSFEEDDHVAIGHFHRLVHFCQRADLVQVSRGWILYARIELRDHSQHLLFALQSIHQRQRAFPAHGQWQDGTRKQDGVPNRQDR